MNSENSIDAECLSLDLTEMSSHILEARENLLQGKIVNVAFILGELFNQTRFLIEILNKHDECDDDEIMCCEFRRKKSG